MTRNTLNAGLMGQIAASIKVGLRFFFCSKYALLIQLIVFPQDIKPAKDMWVLFPRLVHQNLISFTSVDELVTTAAKSLGHAHTLMRPQAKL